MFSMKVNPLRLVFGVSVLWVVSAYAIEQGAASHAEVAVANVQTSVEAPLQTETPPLSKEAEDLEATEQAFKDYVQAQQEAPEGELNLIEDGEAAGAGQPKVDLGKQSNDGLTPKKGQWPKFKVYAQTGSASWYGRPFHGRLTANGERYNMHQMTAAHRYLPLNTLIKVTNLNNGKTLIVRINDRGPYTGPRILDLSYGAASALGFVAKGLAQVKIETIHPDAI